MLSGARESLAETRALRVWDKARLLTGTKGLVDAVDNHSFLKTGTVTVQFLSNMRCL